ncbi:MAG: LamG domain-containing protein [Verrucomicrobiae bacterium]
MKKLLLSFLLSCVPVAGCFAQSPVLSFPFEGSAGEGKVVGKLAFEPGVVGQAGTFDGSTSIEIPHSPAFDVSKWSISAWACPQQEKCSGRIIEKGASDSFWLTFYWGRARFGFWSKEDGYQEIDSSTKFPANEWHHVAGTFDGATLRIYVDGRLEGMRNTAATPVLNKAPLVIGAKRQGIAGDCFIGALDEVSFYNRPLSDSEILAMSRAGN